MTDLRALLERHRPPMVYDSQESVFRRFGGNLDDSPTNLLSRADATVIDRPPTLGLDFLTAQLLGPLLGAGSHEGDEEMIQIRLHATDEPVEAVYAQPKSERPPPTFSATHADNGLPIAYKTLQPAALAAGVRESNDDAHPVFERPSGEPEHLSLTAVTTDHITAMQRVKPA